MIPPNDCATYVGHFRSEEAVAITDSGRQGGRAEHLITSEDFEDFRDGSFRKAEGPKRERERERLGNLGNMGFTLESPLPQVRRSEGKREN